MQIAIRVYGHLRAGFGLAGGAQATVRTLRALGCAVEEVDLALCTHPPVEVEAEPDGPSPHPPGARSLADGAAPVELVHTNPNILQHTEGLLDLRQLRAPVRIGYWAWELEQFPEGWQQHFRHFDEIWCPSAFTAQALAQRSPVPVVAVPHLPDWPQLQRLYHQRQSQRPGPDPARAAGSRPFRFACLFDFWSTPERKNPAGVITAFQRAFPPAAADHPPAELWIKASSASSFPQQAAALKALAGSDPRIRWFDALLSRQQMEQFWLQIDGLVSLHRAEGFGLTIAEAMGIGVPVMATGYSGNLEFSPPGSGVLIPWRPQAIERTAGDYPAGAFWADPDLDAAALTMQQWAREPAAAFALGQQGRLHLLERLSMERITAIVRQRLGLQLLPQAELLQPLG